MLLEILPFELSICKISAIEKGLSAKDFFFVCKTDNELSLVCKTQETPENTLSREDGWKGFRIAGVLDFSLIGILSKISSVLAENDIGIFVTSTYNTDYVLVKKETLEKAVTALEDNGYEIVWLQ